MHHRATNCTSHTIPKWITVSQGVSRNVTGVNHMSFGCTTTNGTPHITPKRCLRVRHAELFFGCIRVEVTGGNAQGADTAAVNFFVHIGTFGPVAQTLGAKVSNKHTQEKAKSVSMWPQNQQRGFESMGIWFPMGAPGSSPRPVSFSLNRAVSMQRHTPHHAERQK